MSKILDSIQNLLNKHNVKLSVVETPVALAATAKSADGKEIGTPTAFETGAECYVTIDGKSTPCPDGEIAMEDGTTIVVKEGKIEEVKPKAEEMEAELSEEVSAVVEKLAERVGALETTNAAQATELSALKATNEELTTKLSAAEAKNVELSAKVVTLSKEPAGSSAKEKTQVELGKDLSPAQRFLAEKKQRQAIIDNELNKN